MSKLLGFLLENKGVDNGAFVFVRVEDTDQVRVVKTKAIGPGWMSIGCVSDLNFSNFGVFEAFQLAMRFVPMDDRGVKLDMFNTWQRGEMAGYHIDKLEGKIDTILKQSAQQRAQSYLEDIREAAEAFLELQSKK